MPWGITETSREPPTHSRYRYFVNFDIGRGHTKETGNRNATAISENCYQPELSTCYWMEQRNLSSSTILGNYGCVAVASFFGAPSPIQFHVSVAMLAVDGVRGWVAPESVWMGGVGYFTAGDILAHDTLRMQYGRRRWTWQLWPLYHAFFL
jgi:hypothetical protein